MSEYTFNLIGLGTSVVSDLDGAIGAVIGMLDEHYGCQHNKRLQFGRVDGRLNGVDIRVRVRRAQPESMDDLGLNSPEWRSMGGRR